MHDLPIRSMWPSCREYALKNVTGKDTQQVCLRGSCPYVSMSSFFFHNLIACHGSPTSPWHAFWSKPLHACRASHTETVACHVLRAFSPRGCIHHVEAYRHPRVSMSLGTGTGVWRATSRMVSASRRSRESMVITAWHNPLSINPWFRGTRTRTRGKLWRVPSQLGICDKVFWSMS